MHFLSFNLMDKRTTITYIDSNGNWIRANKGVPEQILNLYQEKEETVGKVHAIIDKFAERGLRSLGVAYQEVPEQTKESPGGPWTFCGLLPLFDPPRHDSAETIRRALNLGVCVKMITGNQLSIAKEIGHSTNQPSTNPLNPSPHSHLQLHSHLPNLLPIYSFPTHMHGNRACMTPQNLFKSYYPSYPPHPSSCPSNHSSSIMPTASNWFHHRTHFLHCL